MKQRKDNLLSIKSTREWIEKVKTAAHNADTTVSQFIRDAVNARVEQQQQSQTAKAA